MLSNDISNKLRLRFKRSKDFNKLIKRLEKEGYYIKQSLIKNEKCITVSKNNRWLLDIIYEENTDEISEYKQNIHVICY